MPQLDELVIHRQKKKFIKKSYRPWDLSGGGSPAETEIIEPSHTLPKNTHSAQSDGTPLMVDVHKAQKITTPNIGNGSGVSLSNNSVTIKEQLDNNWVTVREQLDNNSVTSSVTNKVAIDNDLDNHINANSLRNRLQKLSGFQRKILEFVLDISLARNTDETGPIETQLIMCHTQTSYGSVKTSLNRLIQKQFLNRKPGRTAKGGYINLSLPTEVKSMLIHFRNNVRNLNNPIATITAIREQLDNKLGSLIYSSSNNNINIKTTTTTDLPESWQKIKFDSLRDIGFSEHNLKHLCIKNLNSPEVVQESINHFSYGLENNPKIKSYTDKLNVLMGVLRKGQAWIESGYRSPQEIALESILQQKKLTQDRMKSLEENLYKITFSEWEGSLTSEQIKLIENDGKFSNKAIPKGVKLSLYFRENVWPTKQIELLNEHDFLGGK